MIIRALYFQQLFNELLKIGVRSKHFFSFKDLTFDCLPKASNTKKNVTQVLISQNLDYLIDFILCRTDDFIVSVFIFNTLMKKQNTYSQISIITSFTVYLKELMDSHLIKLTLYLLNSGFLRFMSDSLSSFISSTDS